MIELRDILSNNKLPEKRLPPKRTHNIDSNSNVVADMMVVLQNQRKDPKEPASPKLMDVDTTVDQYRSIRTKAHENKCIILILVAHSTFNPLEVDYFSVIAFICDPTRERRRLVVFDGRPSTLRMNHHHDVAIQFIDRIKDFTTKGCINTGLPDL